MKAYLFVDMEGITGVTPGGHNEVTDEEKHLLQVGDVNAAIEGALEGGATEVLVQMAHGRPRLRELHPKAEYVTGAVLPLCLSGMDESFGCVLHVGCHARAGAERGVLGHTVTGRVFELRLNGVVVGEAGIVAAMAGQFGVPTVLVTGDDVTCEEARELLGDIEVAVVKRGLGYGRAHCLPPGETSALIRERAAAAVRRAEEITPYRVEPPFVVRTVYKEVSEADARVTGTGMARRLDGRTVETTTADLLEALNLSW
jgi:D-amino peptidase